MKVLSVVIVLFASLCLKNAAGQYRPDWTSLDSRPLPQWFDQSKVGIFLHWGVFSVPSFGSEWFWNYWNNNKKEYVDFMRTNFKPNFTYAEFAPMFRAEFFDPDAWSDLFQASGAKYVVLTTKHHEGFTLWPSNVSWNWNANDVGPKRDIVGDLASSVRRRTDLRFGVYHSLFEWFNPLFLMDKSNNFTTDFFVRMKTLPELKELVLNYKPDMIWSDGDEDAQDDYWKSKEFLAWLYNKSPVRETVVVNDRWGKGIMCHHGGYFTCQDRYNPGKLQTKKWENAMTLDKKSWGFRRDATLSDLLTMEDLITTLVETVAYGGNLLVNVGPTHDGRIVPVFEERLRAMGKWLEVNGEAIYGSVPWKFQNDSLTPGVWFTSKSSVVYVMTTTWPKDGRLLLGSLDHSLINTITMLGTKYTLQWEVDSKGTTVIHMPAITPTTLPCSWAWTLKVSGNCTTI